jgi:hypothetical protein
MTRAKKDPHPRPSRVPAPVLQTKKAKHQVISKTLRTASPRQLTLRSRSAAKTQRKRLLKPVLSLNSKSKLRSNVCVKNKRLERRRSSASSVNVTCS